MKLQYIAAEKSDIAVIFTEAKNLIDTYEDLATIQYDKVLAWVKNKITTHISEYCCVVLDGEKCAYYRLCEDGELDDVYVLSSYQSRGIGSQIMEKCIAESKKNLYLYVFSANTRAISFYKRFGFSVRESVGESRLILQRKG